MRLNHKHILDLPVYTVSQNFLGRVKDFEIDTATHEIRMYAVGSSSLVKKILGERVPELAIASDQVVSLDEEKMIVEDKALREKIQNEERALGAAAMPATTLLTREK